MLKEINKYFIYELYLVALSIMQFLLILFSWYFVLLGLLYSIIEYFFNFIFLIYVSFCYSSIVELNIFDGYKFVNIDIIGTFQIYLFLFYFIPSILFFIFIFYGFYIIENTFIKIQKLIVIYLFFNIIFFFTFILSENIIAYITMFNSYLINPYNYFMSQTVVINKVQLDIFSCVLYIQNMLYIHFIYWLVNFILFFCYNFSYTFKFIYFIVCYQFWFVLFFDSFYHNIIVCVILIYIIYYYTWYINKNFYLTNFLDR